MTELARPALLAAAVCAPALVGGCDPLAGFEPVFARVEEVRVEAVPLEAAEGRPDPWGGEGAPEVFVRVVTPDDTLDSAVQVTPGVLPLRFVLPRPVDVMTSDYGRAGGELVVEVRDCDRGGVAGCAESDLLGRVTAGPDGWRGRERVLTGGGAVVAVSFGRYEG